MAEISAPGVPSISVRLPDSPSRVMDIHVYRSYEKFRRHVEEHILNARECRVWKKVLPHDIFSALQRADHVAWKMLSEWLELEVRREFQRPRILEFDETRGNDRQHKFLLVLQTNGAWFIIGNGALLTCFVPDEALDSDDPLKESIRLITQRYCQREIEYLDGQRKVTARVQRFITANAWGVPHALETAPKSHLSRELDCALRKHVRNPAEARRS